MVSRIDNITSIPDIEFNRTISELEANRIVENYVAELSNTQQQFPACGNLIDAMGLIQNAIWSRQNSENIAESKRLLVLMDDPPENIDTEAITFALKSRTPGTLSQGPAGNSGVKEVVPHIRSVVQHPEHPGEKLVNAGKIYDNVIDINVYARNNVQALRRTLWTEEVLSAFNWYFRIHNIRLIELGIGEKKIMTIDQLELNKYSISYFVRTEDTYQFGSQELRRVLIKTNVYDEED